MSTRSPAKFLFNDDFANTTPAKAAVAVAEHAAKLRDAEAVGYARGFAAAKEEAAKAEWPSTVRRPRSNGIAAALAALKDGLSAVEVRLESRSGRGRP